MRTLELNKSKLWIVTPTGTAEETDSDGFLTGQMLTTYSLPTPIQINIYPTNGAITNQIFGEDINYDQIAVSNEIVLDEDALLFLTYPSGDYEKTYDFVVSKVVKSINTYNYGLRSRT